MRIGHGFDVHAFSEAGAGDGAIVLGGVRIPHERSLLAHSDGDVLLHALCDALLGALALGDIGTHFPDSDASIAGIDSRELLRQSHALVRGEGYCLGNADMTIVAQAPRMAAYVQAMRETIAGDLDAHLQQISVKATTTERLGYVGRGEGIAVHAVVLLQPI